MTGFEALQRQALDWIYTKSQGRSDVSVGLTEFMTETGTDLGTAMGIVSYCASQGLIQNVSGMGNPAARLTGHGIREVQQRRARASDPVLRVRAARNALLRWLYEQHLTSVNMAFVSKFTESAYAQHEGSPFTLAEIGRAAAYLVEKDLIKGVSAYGATGPIRANITPLGMDCIENGENVSDFVGNRGGSNPTFNVSVGTINSSGALVMSGTNFTQQVTVGTDPAALANFARTLLENIDRIPLSNETAGEARSALQEASSPDATPEQVSGAFQRFVGYLADAGKPVVTAAFMLIAQHYGLPSA
ncbi:hypothetical protein [Dactylosporangium sp. NPDC050588]|uniref:hypothetical protein n=1 Tax=Dactylosporangium sp. NPDC050588 TaxID=3157211 RepID=UPI0033F4185A